MKTAWNNHPSLLYHQSTIPQSVPSQKIQHGIVVFIFMFSNFLSLNSKEKGFEIFCETNLINCIYSTSDKPNAKSSSGLNSTLLASSTCERRVRPSSGRRNVVSWCLNGPKRLLLFVIEER